MTLDLVEFSPVICQSERKILISQTRSYLQFNDEDKREISKWDEILLSYHKNYELLL